MKTKIMTFKKWSREVEDRFRQKTGGVMWVYGDFPTRDLYDDGFSVKDAVDEIIDMIRDMSR